MMGRLGSMLVGPAVQAVDQEVEVVGAEVPVVPAASVVDIDNTMVLELLLLAVNREILTLVEAGIEEEVLDVRAAIAGVEEVVYEIVVVPIFVVQRVSGFHRWISDVRH